MSLLDIAIASVLALLGGGLSVFAAVSSRHVLRVLREKTSRIADLVPGPAEIVGDLRAETPVLTIDGSRAVAVRWAVYAFYRKDEETSNQSPKLVYTLCSSVEVTDGTGACTLDLDRFVLLGPRKEHTLVGESLARKHPELASRLPAPEEGHTLEVVLVEETIVPEGVRGFVSGEAVLEDTPTRSAAYRDGKRTFKLRGTDTRPLIVSGSCQKQVVRALLRPVLNTLLLGVLSLLLAALSIAIPHYLRSRAGL